MKKAILIFTALTWWTNIAVANDDVPKVDFDFAQSYISLGCDFEKAKAQGLVYNEWFSDYDKAITQYALTACQHLYDNKSDVPSVDEYWSADVREEILTTILNELSERFALQTDATAFDILKQHHDEWRLKNDFMKEGAPLPPNFDKRLNNNTFKDEYYLTTPSGLPRNKADRFALNDQQNAFCKKQFDGAQDCEKVFDEYQKVTNKLSVFHKLKGIQKHNAYLKIQNTKWDKFTDNSRFQTFIDVSFTSLVYREHLSDAKDIPTPPPLQLFAIRPSLVYEHLDKAPKGDRDEIAIALEWIGFNAWDLSLPVGISIASVYADREYGKSVGHGLMLHVNNSFSFGFAIRDSDDTSFYVNFELMDWFGDKQNKLEQYTK